MKIKLELSNYKKVYKIVFIRFIFIFLILYILTFSNLIQNLNTQFKDNSYTLHIILFVKIAAYLVLVLFIIPHNIKILVKTIYIHYKSAREKLK